MPRSAGSSVIAAVDMSGRPATGDQPAADPRLQGLRADLAKTAGVAAVTQPLVNDSGSAAVMTVTPTRIPAARSSSSSNPLNTYNQVTQRSSDRRCQSPALALASSGDG